VKRGASTTLNGLHPICFKRGEERATNRVQFEQWGKEDLLLYHRKEGKGALRMSSLLFQAREGKG